MTPKRGRKQRGSGGLTAVAAAPEPRSPSGCGPGAPPPQAGRRAQAALSSARLSSTHLTARPSLHFEPSRAPARAGAGPCSVSAPSGHGAELRAAGAGPAGRQRDGGGGRGRDRSEAAEIRQVTGPERGRLLTTAGRQRQVSAEGDARSAAVRSRAGRPACIPSFLLSLPPLLLHGLPQ